MLGCLFFPYLTHTQDASKSCPLLSSSFIILNSLVGWWTATFNYVRTSMVRVQSPPPASSGNVCRSDLYSGQMISNTVKPFFRGGLIFVYFVENENSAKIKPAKIKIGKSHCRSVGAACMHAYCTTHTKFA